MASIIIKLIQDRLTGEKNILNNAYRGLIEMGSKKWPKQAAFIPFRQTIKL